MVVCSLEVQPFCQKEEKERGTPFKYEEKKKVVIDMRGISQGEEEEKDLNQRGNG